MRELKRYKEELAVIGLLSLVLLAVRWVSASFWPTTGQYIMSAETETVFWVVLRMVIYTLAAWVGLRVVAPKAYNWLKHDIVDGFSGLTSEQKTSYSMRMYAILFFGLMMLAMSGCSQAAARSQRTCVVESAEADLGVRERTGKNDGPEVESYLAHVGLNKGQPWCAAFVSYYLSACGVQNPRSAWSPAFAVGKDQVWTPRRAKRSPLPGDVFSVFYVNLGRVGHVGFVKHYDGRYITTIEGNTSGPGSREGDGVYSLKRSIKKLHAITNYIKDTPGTARVTGTDAGRVQAATRGAAHVDPAGQRSGTLGATRHSDHRATGQCGAACAFATTGAEPATGAHQQWERYCGTGHPGWPGHGALHVRQPGAGATPLGTLDAGDRTTRGNAHGDDHRYAHAQVGMVRPGCITAARTVAAVAAAETFHQTLLT